MSATNATPEQRAALDRAKARIRQAGDDPFARIAASNSEGAAIGAVALAELEEEELLLAAHMSLEHPPAMRPDNCPMCEQERGWN